MHTHADVMAKTLAENGVKYVFGLPGGEITAFIDSCRRVDIRFLLTGHESSAALMAQVMGQITGTPGVCAATLGPGATNLVTGVANAYLDRSPLLAVVAQMQNSAYRNMTHQRLALECLFAPVTKRSVTVGKGETSQLVRECLDLASMPRTGPVAIMLPSDVAVQACQCSASSANSHPPTGVAILAPLAQIKERIARSRLPLVLVGLGAPPAAAEPIRKLVDKLQAPFLVTPKAKGILPEDHPLFLGVASGMAIDGDIVATIRKADLVVTIGFDPVEADKTWFTEIEVAALDSASMAEGDYHPLEAVGELGAIVGEITESLYEPKPWPEELLQARRRVLNRSPRQTEKGASPLGLIESLRSIFPRNGIATCDVGSHKLMMGQFWRSYEPGTFFMSNGLSGMGYGIPAAIAAQLVYPDRAVISVVGDGGMLMMLHDLVLIRELNLPLIIVVLTDGSLSLIRVSQKRRGYPACGVDFTAPDFVAIAQGFGLPSRKAKSVSDAKAALETALSDRSFLLLEVPVDLREYDDLV